MNQLDGPPISDFFFFNRAQENLKSRDVFVERKVLTKACNLLPNGVQCSVYDDSTRSTGENGHSLRDKVGQETTRKCETNTSAH